MLIFWRFIEKQLFFRKFLGALKKIKHHLSPQTEHYSAQHWVPRKSNVAILAIFRKCLFFENIDFSEMLGCRKHLNSTILYFVNQIQHNNRFSKIQFLPFQNVNIIFFENGTIF